MIDSGRAQHIETETAHPKWFEAANNVAVPTMALLCTVRHGILSQI